MASVWVIEDGEYSDYHIVGVFSTREGAERVHADYKGGEIVEWPLDLPGLDRLNTGLALFQVKMTLSDGTTESIDRLSVLNEPVQPKVIERSKWPTMDPNILPNYNGPDFIAGTVWAVDEQHAVKIVNESRISVLMQSLVADNG